MAEDLSGMVQQYARGSLILIFGQVTSTVVLALGVILIARFLGSTSYGQMTVATIPVSIAILFSDIGVNSALTKYIAQYRFEGKFDEIRIITRATMLFTLLVGAVLSTIVFSLSGFLASEVFRQPDIRSLIEIASLSLLANNLLTTTLSIFVGFEKMQYHSLAAVLFSVLKSLLSPALILVGYGPFGALLGTVAAYFVTGAIGVSIVLFILLKGDKLRTRRTDHVNSLRLLLSYGYPLFMGGLLSGGVNQVYNFLMAVYVESSLIGNFQIATHFSLLIAFVTMPIATVLFPFFSKFNAKEGGMLPSVFQNSVKYAALLVVPLTAFVMALSEQLVGIIYGADYQYAPLFLKIYVINQLLVGLGSLSLGNLLNGQGKTKVTFVANLLHLCAGLPIGLVLIPQYKVVGLLLTMIVSSLPGLFYCLFWIKRNFGFTIDGFASGKIYTAALVAYIATSWVINTSVWGDIMDLAVGGGVFILTYFILTPLIGAVGEGDMPNLRSLVGIFGPMAAFLNIFLGFAEKLMRRPKRERIGN